ncbi:MAG: ferrous iron transport protein B [candidate division KSB1 bacterium]|nr:ferrous iron transport protein B [candidate division KSB1 bacterium]
MTQQHSRQNLHPHPQFLLVGQPNCGKSTLFNKVAGYRSVATNFPGATVEYTKSHVTINNRICNLVDIPGIYSITSMDAAAEEAKKFLLNERNDVIINIIDASQLARSLELTLQLLELRIPMILCLNMMDEASRKGIEIDTEKLESILQIPVIPAISTQGTGLDELFDAAFSCFQAPCRGKSVPMARHVEEKIKSLESQLTEHMSAAIKSRPRLYSIKLLENDPYFKDQISADQPLNHKVSILQDQLESEHGVPADQVIANERHSGALLLFEKVADVKSPVKRWFDRIDSLLLHPVWGLLIMLGILALFFIFVFKFGGLVEEPLLEALTAGVDLIVSRFAEHVFWAKIVQGALQGIVGGIAIVLPYLLPFLLGMAVIEDIGYLPRIAFLTDSLMHKIGLHGTAVVPALLGYGCSVPAVMATRILSNSRDRFIATVVAVLIPCSARMTIIMGLVGYYLGGLAVFGIYILNLIVIIITGSIMSRLLPTDSPGMIMEMPDYHKPVLKVILRQDLAENARFYHCGLASADCRQSGA